MSKLETFLIKHNIVGTFEELSNSKFNETHNHTRLLMIAFNAWVAIGWSVVLIQNKFEVCYALGDFFSAFGLTGYFMSYHVVDDCFDHHMVFEYHVLL